MGESQYIDCHETQRVSRNDKADNKAWICKAQNRKNCCDSTAFCIN
ncbi:MAG: hypothetical protein PUB96_02945 [Helicobacteraceae bacterium]|nr:hypothetical protein [Helicobacteraceae bacterium]